MKKEAKCSRRQVLFRRAVKGQQPRSQLERDHAFDISAEKQQMRKTEMPKKG